MDLKTTVVDVSYYVTPSKKCDPELGGWWKSRKRYHDSGPKWEKITDEDDLEKILQTHLYTCSCSTNSGSHRTDIEFNVDIKKVTQVTEFL